jgi:hypothetical protein
MIPVLDPVTEWHCPNCGLTDQTRGIVPNRFHTCPKLHGLTAPLLRAGVKAKVELEDRGDYVGSDLVRQGDDGHVAMGVRTTRDDGTDFAVYAGTARGHA